MIYDLNLKQNDIMAIFLCSLYINGFKNWNQSINQSWIFRVD